LFIEEALDDFKDADSLIQGKLKTKQKAISVLMKSLFKL
jgi:hypothetical protein